MHSRENQLSFLDAFSIALGGMIGGGTFVMVGEAVRFGGHAAHLSFALCGLLGWITGRSYTELIVRGKKAYSPFRLLEQVTGLPVAGALGWVLLAGYLLMVALYCRVFGEYLSRLFGVEGGTVSAWLGVLLITAAAASNSMGHREEGALRDGIVLGKIGLIGIIIFSGLLNITPAHQTHFWPRDPDRLLVGVALLFVAYEGFHLLSYRYGQISDHRVNFPRAVLAAIAVAIPLYVLVAFLAAGTLERSGLNVDPTTILADIAEIALGPLGFQLVLVGICVSIASAVHNTLGSLVQLAGQIVEDGELPAYRTDADGTFILYLIPAVLGAASLLLLNLQELISFASFLFLLFFAVVNWEASRESLLPGFQRCLGLIGCLGCLAGVAAIPIFLFARGRPSFYHLLLIGALLLILRTLFVIFSSRNTS